MLITDGFEWINSKFIKSQLTDIIKEEISTPISVQKSNNGEGSSSDPL